MVVDTHSSPSAMPISASVVANQFGTRSRVEMAWIASDVSENRMIAIAREIRMNLACTSMNISSENAISPRNPVCRRSLSTVSFEWSK